MHVVVEGREVKYLVRWTPGHLYHLYLYLLILQFFPALQAFILEADV